MRTLFILLRKDLQLECRTGESLALMVFLSLLVATAIGFGVQSAFVPQGIALRLYPALSWIGFIITGALAMGRSFEQESRFDALEGVLSSGVKPPIIYLSRCIATSVIVCIGHLIGATALALLLDVGFSDFFSEFLLLSGLASFGYAALGSLFGMVSIRSRLRQMLLPLIILPLIFPVFLASLELTTMLFDRSVLEFESPWFSVLIGVDILYLVLGINLFEFVVKE